MPFPFCPHPCLFEQAQLVVMFLLFEVYVARIDLEATYLGFAAHDYD